MKSHGCREHRRTMQNAQDEILCNSCVQWNNQIDPRKRNKMYSFRDLKSTISKTDESELSHTLINYESEDSDMVESNTTETGTSNVSFVTKKKLKMPTPFSGKREDLQKFLQEVKIYLLANSGIYTSDLDKMLNIMSGTHLSFLCCLICFLLLITNILLT